MARDSTKKFAYERGTKLEESRFIESMLLRITQNDLIRIAQIGHCAIGDLLYEINRKKRMKRELCE